MIWNLPGPLVERIMFWLCYKIEKQGCRKQPFALNSTYKYMPGGVGPPQVAWVSAGAYWHRHSHMHPINQAHSCMRMRAAGAGSACTHSKHQFSLTPRQSPRRLQPTAAPCKEHYSMAMNGVVQVPLYMIKRHTPPRHTHTYARSACAPANATCSTCTLCVLLLRNTKMLLAHCRYWNAIQQWPPGSTCHHYQGPDAVGRITSSALAAAALLGWPPSSPLAAPARASS
jgi:hypothetical protein